MSETCPTCGSNSPKVRRLREDIRYEVSRYLEHEYIMGKVDCIIDTLQRRCAEEAETARVLSEQLHDETYEVWEKRDELIHSIYSSARTEALKRIDQNTKGKDENE